MRAGGDATGSVVAGVLADALAQGSRVELHEGELVVDLLTDGSRSQHCGPGQIRRQPPILVQRQYSYAAGALGEQIHQQLSFMPLYPAALSQSISQSPSHYTTRGIATCAHDAGN